MRFVGQLVLIFCWLLDSCQSSELPLNDRIGPSTALLPQTVSSASLVYTNNGDLPSPRGTVSPSLSRRPESVTTTIRDEPLALNPFSRNPSVLMSIPNELFLDPDKLIFESLDYEENITRKERPYKLLIGGGCGLFPSSIMCGVFMYNLGNLLSVPEPESVGSNAAICAITIPVGITYILHSIDLTRMFLRFCYEPKQGTLPATPCWYKTIKVFVGLSKVATSALWLRQAASIENEYLWFWGLTAPFFLLLDASMHYQMASQGLDDFFNQWIRQGEATDITARREAVVKGCDDAKRRDSAETDEFLRAGNRQSDVVRMKQSLRRSINSDNGSLCIDRVNLAGRILALPGYVLAYRSACNFSGIPKGYDWGLASVLATASFLGNSKWFFDPSGATLLPCNCSLYSVLQPVVLFFAFETAGYFGVSQLGMSLQAYPSYSGSSLDPLFYVALAIPPVIEFSKYWTVFYTATTNSWRRVTNSIQPSYVQQQSRLSRVFGFLGNKIARAPSNIVNYLYDRWAR